MAEHESNIDVRMEENKPVLKKGVQMVIEAPNIYPATCKYCKEQGLVWIVVDKQLPGGTKEVWRLALPTVGVDPSKVYADTENLHQCTKRHKSVWADKHKKRERI
jgi:hypothetical protein